MGEKEKAEGWGIYVHIPYCHSKCYYCDFYSRADKRDLSSFMQALITEINKRASEITGQIDTIYIGGGTPSILNEEEFSALCAALCRLLEKNNQTFDSIKEFTIEVNPEDVCEDKAKLWKSSGVNRISMGVQSFNDTELKTLGRKHTSSEAELSTKILKKHFSNISLDLIFGIPGQTLSSLEDSLGKIISLDPEHISVYSLMYEERTALVKMRDKGLVTEIGEDNSVEMFRFVREKLKESGYRQYEISNYARDGFYSIHNSGYWEGKPYLGFGPGAHGYDGRRIRKWNLPDLKKYIGIILTGDSENDIYDEEILNDTELWEEMILTRLRTVKGLSLDEYEEKFGKIELDKLLRKTNKYVTGNMLEIKDGILKLKESGVMISDEIMVDLI